MMHVTRFGAEGDQIEHGNMLSYAEAADLSRGQHDTPEQHAERLEAARRLQEAMVPGASVLHQVNRLDVRGGYLTDYPEITLVPVGDDHELALVYEMEGVDGSAYTGAMLFRDLAHGTRYGARQYPPELIAGEQNIRTYVLAKYAEQRALEAEGLEWDDITPLTELYRFGALAQTDVRMSDVLPAEETAALRDRLTADLADDQANKHLRVVLETALVGVGETEQPVEPKRHIVRRLRQMAGQWLS